MKGVIGQTVVSKVFPDAVTVPVSQGVEFPDNATIFPPICLKDRR
jgi:hypothetical protein